MNVIPFIHSIDQFKHYDFLPISRDDSQMLRNLLAKMEHDKLNSFFPSHIQTSNESFFIRLLIKQTSYNLITSFLFSAVGSVSLKIHTLDNFLSRFFMIR